MKQTLLYLAVATVAFHLAGTFPSCSFLIGLYLFCLLKLAQSGSSRGLMIIGWVIGLLVYGPQLPFFWSIFGPSAVSLWLVLATWLGVFLVLARFSWVKLGSLATALLAPFLWTGLEYFRSELYYLRFSWLTAGYTLSDNLPTTVLKPLGVYGVGFVLMGLAGLVTLLHRRVAIVVAPSVLLALACVSNFQSADAPAAVERRGGLHVAGVQWEFPPELEVPFLLDKLIKRHPQAELLVLSEYTFDGPVPERVKAWCRKNNRYLVGGGKDYVSEMQFYNTAYVVSPAGDVVFRQAKRVPIQFFKDGLPAKEQRIWNSPWGKLGICICYDLGFSRVVDELVRQGAQALIVPSMDIAEWGGHMHRLHARITRIRAAEYGLPIFRLASSGISQLVDANGREIGTAPFPGQGVTMAGRLHPERGGSLPLDRWLAPVCVVITAALAIWHLFETVRAKLLARPKGLTPSPIANPKSRLPTP